MIKFTFDFKEYRIRFKYVKAPYRSDCSIITLCEILNDGLIGAGFARCLREDNFSKEVGRQISLERAIQDIAEKTDLPFSRPFSDFEAAVLDAYWNRSPKIAAKRRSFSSLRRERRRKDIMRAAVKLENQLREYHAEMQRLLEEG